MRLQDWWRVWVCSVSTSGPHGGRFSLEDPLWGDSCWCSLGQCFGVEAHDFSPFSSCGPGSWSDAELNDSKYQGTLLSNCPLQTLSYITVVFSETSRGLSFKWIAYSRFLSRTLSLTLWFLIVVSATKAQIARDGFFTATEIGRWYSHFMYVTSAFKVRASWTLFAYALQIQRWGNDYKYTQFYFSYDKDFVQTDIKYQLIHAGCP